MPILYLFFFTVFALIFSTCVSTHPSGVSAEEIEKIAAATTLRRATMPFQDVLIWTIDDDRALSSHWLRGNGTYETLVASRAGLLFPASSRLWELRQDEIEIPLCDCEKWIQSGRKDECPVSTEVAIARMPRLVDLVSTREVELLPSPIARENERVERRFSSNVVIVGSVGPYLFISHTVERSPCDEGQATWSSDCYVFDVESEKRVDIITPEERRRILESEQTIAFEQFSGDANIKLKSPSDLELNLIEPVLQPGAGLALIYRFTATVFYADSKGNRSVYNRSVSVPAKKLPKALIPYAELPWGLENIVFIIPQIHIGGWLLIPEDVDQRRAVSRAFGLENEIK
ncbi:MAG: hypothetical protein JXA30_19075 [Deltaproteobacteria bacterium]|nr:hypothetical protein [Deltaproteobacteria bacterium]